MLTAIYPDTKPRPMTFLGRGWFARVIQVREGYGAGVSKPYKSWKTLSKPCYYSMFLGLNAFPFYKLSVSLTLLITIASCAFNELIFESVCTTMS